ncbi:MAG: PDZ domain-containing protein [Pirellulaceae bacterium]|nr:PDZ domain-containing protein [Pirellulaceae bacterium]
MVIRSKLPLLLIVLLLGSVLLLTSGCQCCESTAACYRSLTGQALDNSPQSASDKQSERIPQLLPPRDQKVSTGDVLVQEPAQRSALRPNFSSGLRHSNHRNNFFMLEAFKEATGKSWRSTVQLSQDGQLIALGAIVDAEGWIVTKSSELDRDREIECLLFDQRTYSARVVSTVPDVDLALVRIDANGLMAVEWESSIPAQGKWLATTDARSSTPAAIGVVSAGPSRVPSQKAVLGVELAIDNNRTQKGVLVKRVLAGSGAHQAGLKQQDSISGVNGNAVQSRTELLSLLSNGEGGQFLNLTVHRDDSTFDTRVRLMDLTQELLGDETEMEVNGPISARATGFSRVFMHDTVLQPNQCGGPLFNLDGKAVGINIARAGRVSSYALPAETVRSVVSSLLEQAKLISHSTPATTTKASAVSAPLSTAP